MIERLAEALFRFTDCESGESPYLTAIETMAVLRSDHPNRPTHRLAQPALCIVAQGAKWATFGANRLEYRAGQALLIGVETPSVGRVFEARPEEPCLVLLLGLDLATLRNVAEDLDPPPRPGEEVGRGILVADFDGPLVDCALRLMRLLDTPKAIPALYPGIVREICYWLLAGPQGSEVARLALSNAPSQSVIAAVCSLRDRFREPIRVEELAKVARLSPSAFHRQFKTLTSLSPLQYQKQLRLLEARRLMISTGIKVEAAAFDVGYESPSQFSREYARMFGASPKRDVKQMQAAAGDRPEPQAARLAA